MRERAADAVHEARTPAPRFRRGLAFAAIAGVFLAFVGAFGTDDAPFPQRLAFWVGTSVLGGLAGNMTARHAAVRGLFDERPWLGGALIVAILTPPGTLVVWLGSALAFNHPIRVQDLPGFLIAVLVVTVAMTLLSYFITRPHDQLTSASPSDTAPPRFLDRLPLKLRGAALYAVEAEDHYLRLHTDRGQDLILMRLSDAVEELAGIEGARTHRSWWVARDALTDAKRGDGRAILTLKSGVRVPVSRAYAKALREAGWF
ncbi:LytTR family DNA-binding domain-containing protein [Caulobacter sp. NIBR2454]|uniref:LytTR family DNA-binding domain-containing protein n=1 Tax=Caulobacter sp. NIBR2454 TaxID=3015996 RepID=UPI0022B62B8F|nr:LytTR family DNA-binding domain-containing protein [Caulobacter sp. NIBR2454]